MIEKMYSDVSFDDIKGFDTKYLYDSAYSTFLLLQSRGTKAGKVNYQCSAKDAEYAVIEIANDDVPFLVDSLSNELKQREIDIHLICHSTFNVKRSRDGKFEEFAEHGDREYIIQIHIPNRLDDASVKSLVSHIDTILECVNYAVSDWRNMSLKMQELCDSFEQSFTQNESLKTESIAFMQWLINNHIVFLGSIECAIKNKALVQKKSSFMGIMKSSYYHIKDLYFDSDLETEDYVVVRKLDKRSIVHRTVPLDVIIVKKFDNAGKCSGAHLFFGLFTSSVYYQSVRNIPLMRQKIMKVVENYGYPEASHNCKELVTAMESFPRGDLLQMSVGEIYDIATGIVSLSLMPRVKVYLRIDQSNKFVSCIIFIPEKKFSTETRVVIESIVSKALSATVEKRYIQIGDSSLTRLQLIVRLSDKPFKQNAAALIEKEIIKSITLWSDNLFTSLVTRYSKRLAIDYFAKYKNAFDIRYKAASSPESALFDIKFLEESIAHNNVSFDIYIRTEEKHTDQVHLKIYSPDKELAISSTLPVIENLGLFAEEVQTYKVDVNSNGKSRSLYIHNFILTCKIKHAVLNQEICNNLKDALIAIWNKKLEDNNLNSLIISLGVCYRKANLLGACIRYLKQTKYPLSPEYTLQAINHYPEIAKKLVSLFELKFCPNKKANDETEIHEMAHSIKEDLNSITSINEDKALRSLLQLMIAMVRTNFYQHDAQGEFKDYISFKIDSSKVLDLQEPRPFREIFVYSNRLEAIHLRGGRVARGGLRWSDRLEDYRVEVLGLMKAQMTKNSVIVPVGSKGGFIVKLKTMADGRDEFMAEGIECYKTFLRGILDITDNIVAGKISHPRDVIRHDQDDPYLVVAADKGTATFSDIANSISAEYHFWLGDAFASGGSAGYDHKKMAITSLGGWISIVDHFRSMDFDISKEKFTVVGIGDMSGDVFGNGMLMSRNIKLVAAFNHAHIFIDPNPDCESSFKERQRLFNLPRSQWTDYNTSLISKGGGIYSRQEKSIKLSPEASAALGVVGKHDLSTDELLTAILKAPVDLLWNGGIGTYVKAQTESNEKIGDKSNDTIRINGSEVRARAVGEGGNLGFTQLGRVEYSLHGGKINTDFIDNSGGVDCSDHEVNIKITLAEQLRIGKIKQADRDKLLVKMTDDVAKLVLLDNFKQTQIMTIEQETPQNKMNTYQWFMRYLESRGELNRAVEYLPSDEEISVLLKDKTRITRPQIAVLLAYAKNSAINMLASVDLSTDHYLDKFLLEYFPAEFARQYRALIEHHLLKKDILATVLVNKYINILGCTSFHEIHVDTGADPEDIIKAFIFVSEVYDIDYYWQKIESLSAEIPASIKLGLFDRVQSFVSRNISWALTYIKDFHNVGQLIEVYKKDYTELKSIFHDVILSGMKEELGHERARYDLYPAIQEFIEEVYKLRLLKTSLDIIHISKTSKCSIEDAAKVFFKIGESLYFRWLIAQAKNFAPKQYVQITALKGLVAELYDMHMLLTITELKHEKRHHKSLKFLEGRDSARKSLDGYISELKSGDATESFISKITVALNYIRRFK
jgi:glutamate dehydrogenase